MRVCAYVCSKGEEREGGQCKSTLKERKEERKKQELLSLYPCLDFLEGLWKSTGIKQLVLAHQRDLDYASVYPTEGFRGCWRQPAGFEVVMAKLTLKALAAQNITPLLQRKAFSLLGCRVCICLYT